MRELTGDMQLTQREMAETHMIVTTPEKWDVITRKGGDVAAAAAVRLLIMDEVRTATSMQEMGSSKSISQATHEVAAEQLLSCTPSIWPCISMCSNL